MSHSIFITYKINRNLTIDETILYCYLENQIRSKYKSKIKSILEKPIDTPNRFIIKDLKKFNNIKISRLLSSLKKKGFISIEVQHNSLQSGSKRWIKITKSIESEFKFKMDLSFFDCSLPMKEILVFCYIDELEKNKLEKWNNNTQISKSLGITRKTLIKIKKSIEAKEQAKQKSVVNINEYKERKQ